MRALLTGAAMSAALVMIGVSASMNFLFIRQLTSDPVEGLVLGAASACADLLKACLPWFIALAVSQSRCIFAGVGCLVFAGFSAFSLISGLGFAAEIRSGLVVTRAAVSEKYLDKVRELEAIDDQLGRMGTLRLGAEVERDLAVAEQDRRWASTAQCKNATAPASRTFCADYARLIGESQLITDAAALHSSRKELAEAIADLRREGAGGADDPQAAVIARLLAQDESGVRTALIVAVALLVEVGSGLGLWLAVGHSPRPGTTAEGVARPAQPSPLRLSTDVPALPAPTPVGDVVDFCADRLHPTDQGGLTIIGLHRSYEIWCRERELSPKTVAAFEAEFSELAGQWGIAFKGDRYVGVRIGMSLQAD